MWVGRLSYEDIINSIMDNYEKYYREQFIFSFMIAVIAGIVVFFLWLFGVIKF